MQVKAAALVPVVDASGPEMDQSETVTLFNDMCLFAPASLVDPAIAWEPIDRTTARAAFSNAGHTIRAELSFNDAGELIDFRSDDRYQVSPDGKSVRKHPLVHAAARLSPVRSRAPRLERRGPMARAWAASTRISSCPPTKCDTTCGGNGPSTPLRAAAPAPGP